MAAGYAKQVGELYIFLSTQQRGSRTRCGASRMSCIAQTYELSQALKDYDSEEALRFDRVPLAGGSGGERELPLKLEIDGRTVRNPASHVTLRVYSPIQRALDPQIADDNALRQRSAQDRRTISLSPGRGARTAGHPGPGGCHAEGCR